MPILTSVVARLFAATIALIPLVGALVLARQYYADQYILFALDPAAASAISTELLDLLLILGVAGAFVAALLVYTLLSLRVSALTLAHGMTEDITYSREQFRRFYEMSPVPYVLINEKGFIDRPNKAALRFFGKNEEQLIGNDLFTLLSSPDKKEKVNLIRARVLRRIPVDQEEVMAERADGQVRWVLFSCGDIATPGSSAHSGLVTLVDIHEQKELERIKTEFLSLASHQLRSPLANLKWYIDFLLHRRSAELTDNVRTYLIRMNERNEDMIDLVNTLLNMSRVEMGRVKVDLTQTDLAHTATSVLEELAEEAKRKAIVVTREFPDTMVTKSDSKLVRIVFQNLVSNALRYTQENGKVTVRIEKRSSGFVMSVTDTGVGIPLEEQGKIFSKLYRATNARAIEANGNGIGLYMSKALVEALGGTIGFTTELGKGTTFTVTLPATS